MKDSVDTLIEQWQVAMGIDRVRRHRDQDAADRPASVARRRHPSSGWPADVECGTLYARAAAAALRRGPTELAPSSGSPGRHDLAGRSHDPRGYVVRRYDRADRRRNVVVLTRKGIATAERIVEASARWRPPCSAHSASHSKTS